MFRQEVFKNSIKFSKLLKSDTLQNIIFFQLKFFFRITTSMFICTYLQLIQYMYRLHREKIIIEIEELKDKMGSLYCIT